MKTGGGGGGTQRILGAYPGTRRIPSAYPGTRRMPGHPAHTRRIPGAYPAHTRRIPGHPAHTQRIPGHTRRIPGHPAHTRRIPGAYPGTRRIPGAYPAHTRAPGAYPDGHHLQYSGSLFPSTLTFTTRLRCSNNHPYKVPLRHAGIIAHPGRKGFSHSRPLLVATTALWSDRATALTALRTLNPKP